MRMRMTMAVRSGEGAGRIKGGQCLWQYHGNNGFSMIAVNPGCRKRDEENEVYTENRSLAQR